MTDPAAPPDPDWVQELALLLAKARFGPGLDMGGKHNPLPSEIATARSFLEAYVSPAATAGAVEALRAVLLQFDHWASEPRPAIDGGTVRIYKFREVQPEMERALEKARAALAASQPAPALDPDLLTEAMDGDREEALAIIRKHGYVFARDLSEVTDESDEAARWEKLAFTLYTMLLPSNRRSERIAAEYARLTSEAKP